MAVAVAVGEPHLADPPEVERLHESLDALGNQVRVVGRERELEGGRGDVPVVLPLLDRVREVMHLGVLRLLVEVLEQQQRLLLLGMGDDALEPLAAGLHAHALVLGEVVARVHHHPARPELREDVHVALQVIGRRVGDMGRVLGDVHRRVGVQAEPDAVLLEQPAHAGAALRIEGRQRVLRRVELDVDVADPVLRRPLDALLEADLAPEVDADAVFQSHESDEKW